MMTLKVGDKVEIFSTDNGWMGDQYLGVRGIIESISREYEQYYNEDTDEYEDTEDYDEFYSLILDRPVDDGWNHTNEVTVTENCIRVYEKKQSGFSKFMIQHGL